MNRRTLLMFAVLAPILVLFVYVGLTSGPLAPVSVTTTKVESRSISPALFGIGITEVRYAYNIGPIIPGRLKEVYVDVGDVVEEGQILGKMDPIDLNDKIKAQGLSIKRAKNAILAAKAQLRDSQARFLFAKSQAERYKSLRQIKSVSSEVYENKKQELQIASSALASARANLDSSRQDMKRIRSDREGLFSQSNNLNLIAPSMGVVSARNAEVGSTVMAGQSVIDIINPESLWVNVRFDQRRSLGLKAGLPAQIQLRSQSDHPFDAHVLRVEILADAVTEEVLAKVVFNSLPEMLPPIGELTEVTVSLPMLSTQAVVPNAAIKQFNGQPGVWVVDGDAIQFVAVKLGANSLAGDVQVLGGLKVGVEVVVYSQKSLKNSSRIKIVDRLVQEPHS